MIQKNGNHHSTNQSCNVGCIVHSCTGKSIIKRKKCHNKNLSCRQISEPSFVADHNINHRSHNSKNCTGSSVSQRRNDNGEKYSPCETCSRHQNPSGTVYITGSGNRYHNDASCSGLKRTVRLVKKSQLGNMHVCSKCG